MTDKPTSQPDVLWPTPSPRRQWWERVMSRPHVAAVTGPGDSAEDADLDAGGGVTPGATPPDSGQTSMRSQTPQRSPQRLVLPARAALVGVVLLLLMFIAAVVGVISHMVA
ncbi:DUF6480 family protein [Williamsia sterculiae]|uniref:DUF6480 family protein n=1 Tax=Williamsia sterculiae TaxID=1344003 RepID=UPI003899F221